MNETIIIKEILFQGWPQLMSVKRKIRCSDLKNLLFERSEFQIFQRNRYL